MNRLDIIGGAYHEYCIEPHWDEIYGSGFRAAHALSGFQLELHFHTYADPQLEEYLDFFAENYGLVLHTKNVDRSVEFSYSQPLAKPSYFPDQTEFSHAASIIPDPIEACILFGMIEGEAKVDAKRVVYDPQNPSNPACFFDNGSKAEELVMVMNMGEAKAFTKCETIEDIASSLFAKKYISGAVIKNGPQGAYVLTNNCLTPVAAYQTERVWPIGSGDIFTAYFGYQWLIKRESIETAAIMASLATAHYANAPVLPLQAQYSQNFQPFVGDGLASGTVYLAGPFFTMGQRWMVNEFRNTLTSFGLCVFSPLHDVGLGEPDQVVEPDLMALKECGLVLALLDGKDLGTVFEIGYAVSKGIPVLAFVENEKESDLTMLIGSGCEFESDFSSCIYKAFWKLNQREP
jgi:hypothetical protein